MLHKGTNGIIQEKRAIRQNSVTHTVHDNSAADDYMFLLYSDSDYILLTQKTSGCCCWKRAIYQRSSGQEAQRQDQFQRLQLLVAPTPSAFTFLFSFVFFWCSSWAWAKLISHSYLSNSLLSLSRVVLWNEKLKWLFFYKNSVIISFYTSSFNDTATVDFKHKHKYISTSQKETPASVKSN